MPHLDSYLSPEYREVLVETHMKNPEWGASAFRFIDTITMLIKENGYTSVLDYGCGKGVLKKELDKRIKGLVIQEYDPGILPKSNTPQPAQLVACVDVMEHIEEEYVPSVVEHLRELTQAMCYMVIHTGRCGTTLADGRSAHITQRPMEWWQEVLAHDTMVWEYSKLNLPNRFQAIGVKING